MRRRVQNSQRSLDCLTREDLEYHAAGWVMDGKMNQMAAGSIVNRQAAVDRLLWFLERRGYEECGEREVREFLAYVATGHLEPGGRWEEPGKHAKHGYLAIRGTEPVKLSTLAGYHTRLKTFFRWLVQSEVLERSPMERINRPRLPKDQIQPFSEDQVEALRDAARETAEPLRDTALVLFLYDTGARASEALSLTVGDIDMRGNRCSVVGKGGKRRTLYFSVPTEQALWALMGPRGKRATFALDTPLFRAMRGKRTGEAMTPGALTALIRRLGRAAGIRGVRCSAHTLRHSYAVHFLRHGGSVFSLQIALGHESLEMVRRYVQLADADLEAASQIASPVAALYRRKR
jgi:integrase/recombinase XerD